MGRSAKRMFGAAVAAYLAVSTANAAGRGIEQNDLILRDVNIVDVQQGIILPHRMVTIRDGIIVDVADAQAPPALRANTVVDAAGKFLIPGLVEGHAHISTERYVREQLRTGALRFRDQGFDLGAPHAFDRRMLFGFLQAGVTTVFTYGSSLPNSGDLLELRELIAAGKIVGPRLVVGEKVDGSRKVMLKELPPAAVPSSIDAPQTAEHGRMAVMRAKARGYDFIKAYQHLDRETYLAVVHTAHEQGMQVAGHLPQLQCERCFTREQAFDTPLNAIAHVEELSRYAMETDLGAEDLSYLTALVRGSGASVVTTLVGNRNIVHAYATRELPVLPHAENRRVDSIVMHEWLSPNNNYLSERFRNQKEAPLFPAAYDYQRMLARLLWKKGVSLIAGTDAPLPGTPYGDSLIEELIELNKIGLKPHEVLQTATCNAFKFLNATQNAGSIAKGKRADMVLLTANPLEYIGNVRSIDGVVLAGQWLPIARLRDEMEESVRYYKALDTQLGLHVNRD